MSKTKYIDWAIQKKAEIDAKDAQIAELQLQSQENGNSEELESIIDIMAGEV